MLLYIKYWTIRILHESLQVIRCRFLGEGSEIILASTHSQAQETANIAKYILSASKLCLRAGRVDLQIGGRRQFHDTLYQLVSAKMNEVDIFKQSVMHHRHDSMACAQMFRMRIAWSQASASLDKFHVKAKLISATNSRHRGEKTLLLSFTPVDYHQARFLDLCGVDRRLTIGHQPNRPQIPSFLGQGEIQG